MTPGFPGQQNGDWRQRLAQIVDLVRDMSRHNDPQAMVQSYADRVRLLLPSDRRFSVSRRDLPAPKYRITRSSTWPDVINPWKERDRLPLLEGGLVAKLLYGDEPQIIDDLEVPENEPAAEYLAGCRSLVAIPLYDEGIARNMVIMLRKEPAAFPKEELPQLVWMSNLFGRATNNLVLSDELKGAYQTLDREMRAVGEIQRSLLPAQLPRVPTLDLATYYHPAQRAGGDYYDFFPLPSGKWGIFIADVSGHGTPAAVLMAVTHCIAHTNPGQAQPPGQVLEYLNHYLATLYTHQNSAFITAFYGVYDPADRTLAYACAGHNPPRLKRCEDGSLLALDGARGFPLGIMSEGTYDESVQQLKIGDQIVFYTDGITEASNPEGMMFGTDRLDHALENCSLHASALLDSVLGAVAEFTNGHPAHDDRTLIVARVV